MNKLEFPQSLNYIGVFLTFDCNLNCSYCINDPDHRGDRRTVFMFKTGLRTHLRPEEWARGLNKLPARSDLPVTFQGGEPTLYWKGDGLRQILAKTEVFADLLTNFALKPELFSEKLFGQQAKFQRPSSYPSIRVSYHAKEMDKTWGDGLEELIRRCEALKDLGFAVNSEPSESNVGIYIVDHPENDIAQEKIDAARKRVPVFLKDFLGTYKGELHGRYAYPYSTDLISSKTYFQTLKADCGTTELLIDPLGFVWQCHLYLYRSWQGNQPHRPAALFDKMSGYDFKSLKAKFYQPGAMFPIGHILDPDFTIEEIETFRKCYYYGECLECDTKYKRDRFETENVYRSSVIIRNIQWPMELRDKVSNDFKRLK